MKTCKGGAVLWTTAGELGMALAAGSSSVSFDQLQCVQRRKELLSSCAAGTRGSLARKLKIHHGTGGLVLEYMSNDAAPTLE